ELVLRSKGVTDVKTVAARADAADLAPAVKAVTAGDPDAVVVLFPAQSCARIMSAARGLGVKARMFYPSACASQAVVDAAGAAAEDAYFATAYLPFDDPSPEVATWKAEADVSRPSALSQAGFAVVMNVYRLLLDGAGSAGAVTDALRQSAGRAGYMAHPYTCDRAQVPLLPAVCNPYVRLLQYDGGTFVDLTGDWVSGAGLVKLFG
ncbi:MAG TPA: ABC transporter substrate-binding protein, partial [Acidimicrobiales bacterium]|nr:ABC transporter substrate-binding protein [Acidimicrobiales bacterium]